MSDTRKCDEQGREIVPRGLVGTSKNAAAQAFLARH